MRVLRHWRLAVAAVLPLAAVVELVGNAVTAGEVPPLSSFAPAADVIRKEHRPGDLVLFAPDWMGQARVALGEWMTIEDQARGDTFDHPRVWELALEGRSSPETSGMTVLSSRSLDRLTLTLYRNDAYGRPLWHAYDEVAAASVSVVLPEGDRPCPWQQSEMRHSCAAAIGEPWVWTGQTFLTDVQFKPRRCLWSHPTERGPVKVRFEGVPGGARLTGHTGLAYAAYRDVNTASVFLDVEIDGRTLGRIENRGDAGWTTFDFPVPPGPPERTLVFTVTTPSQGMRHFCLDATMRGRPGDGVPAAAGPREEPR